MKSVFARCIIVCMKKPLVLIITAGVLIGCGIVLYSGVFQGSQSSIMQRSKRLRAFLKNPDEYAEWSITANSVCGSAPFAFPTNGMVGYLWDDSFYPGHRHSGIDIFGPDNLGKTPVYTTYDGYLTRLPDWKSTVILRIPMDPLHLDEQIWLYYTHMADEKGNSFIVSEFSPGTVDVFVPQGTLLGYQGNYAGNGNDPVGMHLHFSIVKSDNEGRFLDESKIENTLDPSPYFGIELINKKMDSDVSICP